jgi:hypothetical protein
MNMFGKKGAKDKGKDMDSALCTLLNSTEPAVKSKSSSVSFGENEIYYALTSCHRDSKE